MTSPELDHAVKRMELVNRYATPFAALLVLMAIFFPSPIRFVRDTSVVLLAFSVAFNLLTVALIRRKPEMLDRLRKPRMYLNLTVNVVLVYNLGPYWPPIWLLLALTPIATAIYASPRQSLVSSIQISALILGIQLVHGGSSLVQWGQTLSCAAFVVFLCLLLNDLAQDSGLNKP
jgi:hypothetical protein